jgi:hypothetical protein
VTLPPEAIARYVQERTDFQPDQKRHLHEVYDGIDGRNVDERAAWDLAPELVHSSIKAKMKRDGGCKAGPIMYPEDRARLAKRELGLPLERRWCPETGDCTPGDQPYCGYWSCDCIYLDQAGPGPGGNCGEF